MALEKNQLFELEILKHVEEDARLNNRLAASKLGCSVKLAHELLRKMVDRGCLHIKKTAFAALGLLPLPRRESPKRRA